MDKLVVKEFIQHEMNVTNLKNELQELLTNEKRIAELKQDYADLKNLLSEKGRDGYRDASAKAAQLIHDFTLRK